MEVTGTLHRIFETQQVTDSFKKRRFVLLFSENINYPQMVEFEFIQDKCSLLDSYQPLQEVKIQFNLNGRRWNDPKTNEEKYFNRLQAWTIEKIGDVEAHGHAGIDEESDILPF